MENRAVIKEILSELVSEETIDAAIKEIVNDRLDYKINRTIEDAAHSIVKEKAEKYIEEEVNKVLEKPVKRDDGWGQPEYYDSFEEFVKANIAKLIKEDYRFRSELERMVQKRMDGILKKVAADLSEKVIIDAALAEMAKENN